MKDNESMRIYMNNRRLERKKEAIEYLGSKCTICGAIENLEFDHIDPKTKEFEISDGFSHSKEKLWGELEKCQLLCSICHIEKSKKDFYKTNFGDENYKQPHGTHYRYVKYKCRCDECISAFQIKEKEYKRNYFKKKNISV